MRAPPFSASTVLQVTNALGAASTLAFVFGAIMTFDCRSWSKTWDQAAACYLQGGSVMGLGGLGKTATGMFAAGYQTYNPALRRPGSRPLDPDRDVPGGEP